jgi:hypothetical protein
MWKAPRWSETTFGLDDEPPDEEELENEEADVDKIVPPPDGLESPRVDKLVESNGESNGEVLSNISIVIVRRFVIDTHKDSETLGTEVKGQNLEAVGNEKWGIGDVVEHVEQEDGGDGGLGRGLVLECTEQRYGDGPHAEYNQHACIANEE